MTRMSSLERPARGEGRILVGVCAALADRFRICQFLVRFGFVIFASVGIGEVVSLILWIVIPRVPR